MQSILDSMQHSQRILDLKRNNLHAQAQVNTNASKSNCEPLPQWIDSHVPTSAAPSHSRVAINPRSARQSVLYACGNSASKFPGAWSPNYVVTLGTDKPRAVCQKEKTVPARW